MTAIINMDVTISHPHRRRFKLINKAFRRNYEFIHDDDGNTPGATHKGKTPLFVIDTSVFTRGKPDITLHRGPDDSISSPAVACCYIPTVTRTFRVGLGDAVQAQELMHWEEMRRTSLSMSKFAWSMDLPDGRRPALMWKRTSHHAVDRKKANALSGRNWKLVKISDGPDYATAGTATATANVNAKHNQDDTSSDEHDPKTDEILAVFTSATGITTACGTLQVNVDWGSAFDYMVLVTLVAMYEKLKRSRHNSGGGGGGGGG
jgi:hypothetical protein